MSRVMSRRSQTLGHLQRECRNCGKQIAFGMFVGFLTMYLICAKCHRILRANNAEKHAKKCQNATFNCCDCNDEFDVETLATHTVCANAIKTLSPAVFNPKAVVFGAMN